MTFLEDERLEYIFQQILNFKSKPIMKKIILSIVIIAFLGQLGFAGGPWPQKKGEGYFKLTQWWTVFDQHFTDVGLLDPNATTGIFNTSFYGEYGLTDNLTGIVYAPFFSRNYINNLVSGTTGDVLIAGDAINTIGDTDIGLKYGFKTRIPLAATITFGLPLGTSVGGEQNNLQTGDGEFNQMLQLESGFGLDLTDKISFYSSALAGVNNRTKGFSDEFRYSLEAGFGFNNKKLWLISRLVGIESFKNGTASGEVTSTSLFANNSEHTSLLFEAAYYISKKVGVSASYGTALRGEIIAAAPAYSVGVFLDLSKK